MNTVNKELRAALVVCIEQFERMQALPGVIQDTDWNARCTAVLHLARRALEMTDEPSAPETTVPHLRAVGDFIHLAQWPPPI